MEKNSSLDRLAHIANITQELTELNRQIKEDKTPDNSDSGSYLNYGNSSLNDPKNKTRRLACTWCRQQKSKCDAQQRLPLPCTRCEKKGLQCEMKPDFRRTEKRARIASIEKEFAELKKSFANPQAANEILRLTSVLSNSVTPLSDSPILPRPNPMLPHTSAQAVPQLPSSTAHLYDHPQYIPPIQPRPQPTYPNKNSPQPSQLPESILACEEKSIGDITLDSRTIGYLYLEYYRRYHHVLPVVDILKGPERTYRLCPALFWVIMFVALRRYDDDRALLRSLLPRIKEILSEITISPITRYNPSEEDEPIINACSVYSVQAFVLYSIWPPLTSSLSSDSSWNTIGVALFHAIRIGLHSSGQVLQDAQKTPIPPHQYALAQEQMKTWIICNIASQNIASVFGYPAFSQYDSLKPHLAEIPQTTRDLMEIAHFEEQVAKSLTYASSRDYGNNQINERLSLIKVLLRQLDELEIKLSEEVEFPYRKIKYLVARVHLLTHYFLDASGIPQFELSKGLVRLYNAAISLIKCVLSMYTKDDDLLNFMPVMTVLNIWQASLVIVKLANSPLKTVLDVELGKLTYTTAISLVAKASILKHDIAYRASGIMRNMWPLFRTLDEKGMTTLAINTRSRMSASLFFDCLSVLRDQVGMAQLNIRTDTNENGDEDIDGQELDLNGSLGESEEEDHVKREPTEGGSSNVSQKSTPGSVSSSGKRKRRSFSNLADAENKARKIIRTIPLDPQPISASKRSSIFKIVNTSQDTSPRTEETTSRDSRSPMSARKPDLPRPSHPPNATDALINRQTNDRMLNAQESPSHAVGNLDMFDINSDMLWKDVDSLMNDFGFHP